MGNLDGLGLEFDETLAGWIGVGVADPEEGKARGKELGTSMRFDVKIMISDLERFLNISSHTAGLTGTVTFEPLGGKFTIKNGVFNLFTVDPDKGIREITYSFKFTARNGQTYFLHGQKRIADEGGILDVPLDMTTLFTKVYQGEDETAPLYGAGVLTFNLLDTASLVASIRVTGATWPWQKVAAEVAFISFTFGVMRDVYFRDLNPFYDSGYENLVLTGEASQDGVGAKRFFLVSGVHDKGFPWGDGEIFWDVLLVIGDESSGYRRFCITDRVLQGLFLDVEHGTYRYEGPIFELVEGYSTSFSEMRAKDKKLIECEAEFEIEFAAKPYATTPLPFLIADNLIAPLTTHIKAALRDILPSEHILGIYITPHTVTIKAGSFRIEKDEEVIDLSVNPAKTFGEAESSTLKNLKQPIMLYGYICAVRPEAQMNRVQIHANSMRKEPQYWVKDQMDAFLGALISQITSKEMLMENGHLTVHDLDRRKEANPPGQSKLFEKIGDPLIEVNNNHFPTAVFQRRIIRVLDPSGSELMALEEDMDLMRLDAINSGREVTVAALKGYEKLPLLENVLKETKFWDIIDRHRQESQKDAADFSIVIKPNFMFAYNKDDHTTYTDPALVNHLVKLLIDHGYKKITVVEAQSTYGEYFYKRSVKEVAQYLNYSVDGALGYNLVDLTEDSYEEQQFPYPLGLSHVPLTWRDADFRISFAKNKTHAYAFYTLTLKNVYGALPLANKFKEYHVDRDIYHTAIEYMQKFPMHYGLIDAISSADGPFGIFADSEPNYTNTIIGGSDLVAVDWVGSTKMGLDPFISAYMRLAVDAFGKPKITLIGDRNPYKPWLNVPMILTLFTHYGLDANYYFGNLFYMTGAYMDEKQFTHKSKSAFVKAARIALKPLQTAIFLQTGGERTAMNRLLGKFEEWLGNQ